MKDLAWITLLSVRCKLNVRNCKYCFEIFGFDFLLDEELSV